VYEIKHRCNDSDSDDTETEFETLRAVDDSHTLLVCRVCDETLTISTIGSFASGIPSSQPSGWSRSGPLQLTGRPNPSPPRYRSDLSATQEAVRSDLSATIRQEAVHTSRLVSPGQLTLLSPDGAPTRLLPEIKPREA